MKWYNSSMFKRKQLPYNQTFSFHGNKINYHVIGKGKPVIFVHGAFTNSSSYHNALTLLSKNYQIYILDLPGFGGSDVIKGKLHTPDLSSEALTTLIKKNNLQSASIIALSLGVIPVVKAASKGILKGHLLLISPPGHPDKGILTQIFTKVPVTFRRALISTYWGRKNILLPAASANTGTQSGKDDLLLEHISYTSNEALVDTDYIKEVYGYGKYFKKLKNKVTILYGEHDRMKDEKFDFIKKYVEIPRGGHNILSDSPKATIKVLDSLL